MSISNGIVRCAGINCYLAGELGQAGVRRIVRTNFKNIKFKKKDKLVTLAAVISSLRLGNITVTSVQPLTLFLFNEAQ